MKTRYLAFTAIPVLMLLAGESAAEGKKTLAIVVKGLDNPFFEQINLGCKKWLSENPDSEYECLYTGPASSADEAGVLWRLAAFEAMMKLRLPVSRLWWTQPLAPCQSRILRQFSYSATISTGMALRLKTQSTG